MVSEAVKAKRNEKKKIIGQRILAGINRLGITQTELAAKVGISEPYLSLLISGRRGPGRETLETLAAALGMTQDALTAEEAGASSDPAPTPPAPVAETGPAHLRAAHEAAWNTPLPENLPPGLAGYLERNTVKDKITLRERFYLANSRASTEPWVVFDDTFWRASLRFWRDVLAEQDARLPGTKPGP